MATKSPCMENLPSELLIEMFTYHAPPSYVMDGNLPVHMSPITHVFPTVCKEWHLACKHDATWKNAASMMCSMDDNWKSHLDALTVPASTSHFDKYKMTEESVVHTCMPMFFMRSRLQLNRPFQLHFFEPRYRRLIARVMEDVPIRFKSGEPITQPSYIRRMIYCPANSVNAGSMAFICEVRRCQIANDGQADVELNPVLDCVLERVFVLPHDEDVDLHSAKAREIGGVRAITQRENEQVAGPTGGASMGSAEQQGLVAFIQMLMGGGAGPDLGNLPGFMTNNNTDNNDNEGDESTDGGGATYDDSTEEEEEG